MLDDIDPLVLASIFWNLIKNTEPEGLKNHKKIGVEEEENDMFVVGIAKEKEANLDPGDESPLTRESA